MTPEEFYTELESRSSIRIELDFINSTLSDMLDGLEYEAVAEIISASRSKIGSFRPSVWMSMLMITRPWAVELEASRKILRDAVLDYPEPDPGFHAHIDRLMPRWDMPSPFSLRRPPLTAAPLAAATGGSDAPQETETEEPQGRMSALQAVEVERDEVG